MRNESFSSEMNAPLNGNIFRQNVINRITHITSDTRRDGEGSVRRVIHRNFR